FLSWLFFLLRCCVFIYLVLFFFVDPVTTEFFTLSLHDALPICVVAVAVADVDDLVRVVGRLVVPHGVAGAGAVAVWVPVEGRGEMPVAVVAVHVFEGVGRY